MTKFFPFLIISFLLALTMPQMAQSDGSSLEQLRQIMAAESQLTEDDVKIYLDNIKIIFQLSQSPEEARSVLSRIPAWSENRFTYVTTKMGVGMSMLLRPDDPRNEAAPDFAKPTAREMDLIQRYKIDLTNAVENL
ncbi:MAG: hypothetical protein ACRCTY_01285 [Candidatus Adiutrix sp.]